MLRPGSDSTMSASPTTEITKQHNFFGDIPSLPIAIIFLTTFCLLLLIHIILTIKSRAWWTIINSVGIVGEALGWFGRVGGHFHDYSLNLCMMQNICLGLAPVFYSATCYIMFGLVVKHIDPTTSRLRLRNYAVTFLSFDVACLSVQGAGGALSGLAANNIYSNPGLGAHVMVAGIALQLVNMITFVALLADYFSRMRIHHSHALNAAMTKPMTFAVHGIVLASLLVLLRNTYRVIEMGIGFHEGAVYTNETYFDCLDALPMCICGGTLAMSHPYFTFQRLPLPACAADISRSSSDNFKKQSEADMEIVSVLVFTPHHMLDSRSISMQSPDIDRDIRNLANIPNVNHTDAQGSFGKVEEMH